MKKSGKSASSYFTSSNIQPNLTRFGKITGFIDYDQSEVIGAGRNCSGVPIGQTPFAHWILEAFNEVPLLTRDAKFNFIVIEVFYIGRADYLNKARGSGPIARLANTHTRYGTIRGDAGLVLGRGGSAR